MSTAAGLLLLMFAAVGIAVVGRTLWRRLVAEGLSEDRASSPWSRLTGRLAEPFAERELRRVRLTASSLAAKHGNELERAREDVGFARAVRRLSRAGGLAARAAISEDEFVSAIGLSALARQRHPRADLTDWAIAHLRSSSESLEPFLYAFLLRHASHPVIGSVLGLLDEEISRDHLANFIRERQRAEPIGLNTFEGRVPYRHAELLESFAREHADTLGEKFADWARAWAATTPEPAPESAAQPREEADEPSDVVAEAVASFARIWSRPFDEPRALLVGSRGEIVDRIAEALAGQPRKSVLVVGETGVGKTRLIRAALDRLSELQPIFEAGAAQAAAGCVYVGELETRIAWVVETVLGTESVWIFPQLDEAIYTGQHSRNPRGMIDALLPHIKAREVTLVAEVTPAGFERLMSERPGAATSFEVIHVPPLGRSESIAVARASIAGTQLEVTDETLIEAYELTHQFANDTAPPGNLLGLVQETADELLEVGRTLLEPQDILRRLATTYGLPLIMLDRNTPLDLEQVTQFFASRVLNQPEALEAAVDRIALIKAGLSDPNRPLGVLFFVGPTGTGKTELARSIAEFIFGTADRLIRLDMSEYQTADAFERLLASAGRDGRGTSLLSSVRRDPFAVILLDEFEKAAPPVFDLFLQVFEDGRLTDQNGETVDFRRTLLIMTSNIGSAVESRPGIGFNPSLPRFDAERLRTTVETSFRAEFVNRLDRIVVFRPFERPQMRALLDKELTAALARPGLRTRPWAIELEERAYEFLIDRGFSANLGARPLKRAVERFLLAPLAAAIVGQGVPKGDQFLLVSAADDELLVRFVDPDAEPIDISESLRPPPFASEQFDIRTLALSPVASAEAAAFLDAEVTTVEGAAQVAGLPGLKADALMAMSAPGFWEQEPRFETLTVAEYLDRFDAALATTQRLSRRLSRAAPGRDSAETRDLTKQVASRLHVLTSALAGLEAGTPTDLFLRLRAWDRDSDHAEQFLKTLVSMYEQWSTRRGMQLRSLLSEEREHVYGVSGLGCGFILEREAGLHVLSPGRDQTQHAASRERIAVHVCTAPWPAGPKEADAVLLERARHYIEEASCTTELARRYRTGSAPLVKDYGWGYRTGRLSDVLSGDFDLFT